MKRQRGRNRGGGGGGGGGGKPQHNVNRAFDSNGPDNVKIRGHAQHVFEKYQQLARDAFASGDRVLAENYLQHADHYFRVLRTIQPQRPAAEILGRDVFASGLDIDFEEEFEPGEDNGEATSQGEGEALQNGDVNSDGRRDARNEGRRDNREGYEVRESRRDNREGFEGREPRRENGDRFEGRGENRSEGRNTENRNAENRTAEGRGENRGEGRAENRGAENREGREGRFDRREGRRFREDRAPREARGEAEGANETPRDPLAVVSVASEASSFPTAESVEAEGSPVLRSQDGGVSEAPAFLQGAPTAEEGEVRRPRTRRRRAPRTFEGGEESGEAAPAPAAEDA